MVQEGQWKIGVINLGEVAGEGFWSIRGVYLFDNGYQVIDPQPSLAYPGNQALSRFTRIDPMTRTCLSALAVLTMLSQAFPGEPGGPPRDKRLAPVKTLNDYFPFTPPSTKEAWEKRRQEVREQVLVANGLWPMPEKIPLKPTIHGKIEREGYTIEKVFFASYPGHYVCGNLYRPTERQGKLPAVLCPHGHWPDGRFYEAKDWESQMKQGAEQTKESALYPLQARCVQLARMGCVVFFYDMVGYADSQQIPHRAGFVDPEAELRQQNFMGLQTFNTIRALDFLMSLSEVDAKRIGVTGASGGGTQTFILGAIDDRPAAAFPAVMVSTAMQGGCICENASYLRIGTGNIELAAAFAPRPLGMSGANDWTIDIETKGLPELKTLYKMLGVEDRVQAKTYKQFGHNYNQVSRELMYNFFDKHLNLGHDGPVQEKPFVPVPPRDLSVFDAQHPLPKDAVNVMGLRRYLTTTSDEQLENLMPKDAGSLAEFRKVMGPALRALVTDRLPSADEVVEVGKEKIVPQGDLTLRHVLLSRKGQGEAIAAVGIRGKDFSGQVVVWIHPRGQASLWQGDRLVPAAQAILDKKGAILAPDLFWTGQLRGSVVQIKLDPKRLPAGLTPKGVDKALTGASQSLGLIRLGEMRYLHPSPNQAKALADLGGIPVQEQAAGAIRLDQVASLVARDELHLPESFAGYTFGYNRPLVAERIHDLLTAVAHARTMPGSKSVHLVGFEKAGPWVVLARGLCGDAVGRTAADLNNFRFEQILSMNDEMMLPGALKYGGLPALAALCAPHELFLHNTKGAGSARWLEAAYQADGQAKNLIRTETRVDPQKVVDWVIR